MANQFTEGPWEVRVIDGEQWPERRISIGPNNGGVATAVAISPRYAKHDQMVADAHLIAAAPDLYDALENLMGVICGNGGTKPDAHGMALAALSKARGETE